MKTSVFIATSLDGFIAREDGSLDWLPPGGGEDHGYAAFIATVDAVVMGRNTYETVLAFDTWPYPGLAVIVLSTRALQQPTPQGAVVEVMAGPPRDIVARLAERGMKHLYIDGGITVQRFLDAGLIQHFTLTRIPVLLGRGIPLFGPTAHDIRFRHVVTRSTASGMVTSEYAIERAGESSAPVAGALTP
jgi:dihydrofolate reductase